MKLPEHFQKCQVCLKLVNPLNPALLEMFRLVVFTFLTWFVCFPLAWAEEKVSSDQAFLDEIERKALDYFLTERNPETGLVRDWAWNGPGESVSPASVAASGFALTAYGVGVERGWLKKENGIELARQALLFLNHQAPQEHGFFYHFLTMGQGARAGKSEVSPIDTTLAVAGVLFAGEYFKDPEIKALAREIWERIDWTWMLNGDKTFALAWSPERKFYPARWSNFDESLLMYFLALGSPTHPIPESSWGALRRPVGSYGRLCLIQSPPLFTHQFPHIWIDFRDKHDRFADYFENSKNATLAQRQCAIDQSQKFKSYGPDSWGLTATEGPAGYKAYGAPPGWATHDGTVAPSACGASIVFTPDESISCLKYIREHYGDKLWGRYGFSDSFNRDLNFYSKKVFAINQGLLLLMIENYRSRLIWDVMNRIPETKEAFKRAGFQDGTKELILSEPPEITAPFLERSIRVDGDLSDWPEAISGIRLDLSYLESGTIQNSNDLEGVIYFAWDKEFLYFSAQVHDDSIILRRSNGEIWKDDLLELFIDPAGDGLLWQSPSDFQLGFRVDPEHKKAKTWSWFRSPGDPAEKGNVRASGIAAKNGYVIEGAIRWSFLGIEPDSKKEIRITPSIHDIDQDRSEGKLTWFFPSEGDRRFALGRLILGQKTPKNN